MICRRRESLSGKGCSESCEFWKAFGKWTRRHVATPKCHLEAKAAFLRGVGGQVATDGGPRTALIRRRSLVRVQDRPSRSSTEVQSPLCSRHGHASRRHDEGRVDG